MATKKTAKKTVKKAPPAKDLTAQQKVGIGIGLTAAAVTAAGAYFLYGSENSVQNRKKVKSWTLRAKAEVLEKLEQAEEMSQGEYERLIESVSGAYGRLKDASKVDVATFKREMKSHWGDIEKMGKPVKKVVEKAAKKATPKKAVKKVVKKTVEKVAKKATKKVTKK